MTVAILLLLLAPDAVDEQLGIIRRNEKLPYEQSKRARAIASLGHIGSPDSTRELEGLLEDTFGHIQDAVVSALIQLKRQTPEARGKSLELLTDYLARRRKPGVRAHLAVALGLIGDTRAVPGLVATLRKERDPGVLQAIASALARLGDERAVAPLTQRAQRKVAGRADCLRALGGFPNAAEVAWSFWKDGDDATRAAIVDVLVERRREIVSELEQVDAVGPLLGIALADALPAVRDDALARRRAAGLLAHPNWRVRAAAIAAVVRLRDATLVPDLVDVLEREKGRLRLDAWSALRSLTGKDIGPDPAQWRALGPLAGLPDKGVGTGAAPKGTRAYFTLPVFSRRIAFVFDVSGSMRDDSKIQRARFEFKKTAASLRKDQRYDLFVYRFLLEYPPRPRLERAFGKLVAGKARAAYAWLNKQEAKGGGALYDVLLAAMNDDEVDTIYLLSDGVPSYGTISRGWRVVQELKRKNRFRRVVIHGVMLDDSRKGLAFMQGLAEATGGQAVDARGRRLG